MGEDGWSRLVGRWICDVSNGTFNFNIRWASPSAEPTSWRRWTASSSKRWGTTDTRNITFGRAVKGSAKGGDEVGLLRGYETYESYYLECDGAAVLHARRNFSYHGASISFRRVVWRGTYRRTSFDMVYIVWPKKKKKRREIIDHLSPWNWKNAHKRTQILLGTSGVLQVHSELRGSKFSQMNEWCH